jgi:hypothetical protein
VHHEVRRRGWGKGDGVMDLDCGEDETSMEERDGD